MIDAYALGFFWILIAGVTQGAFPLPMKYARRWKWEHVWFWYSIIAFFILPALLALATVPNLGLVYELAPIDRLLWIGLFGAGWGIGSVFFGLGLDALGMALGFPLMTGLFTSLGALIPLFVLEPQSVFAREGLLIITGNAITIFGVTICAIAGKERDKRMGATQASVHIAPKRSFRVGFLICIAGGVLSASFNFGYAFGSPLADVAVAQGSTAENAVNAIWLVELAAGGLINVGYCIYLFGTNRSWALVGRAGAAEWSGVWVMALLWTGSVVLYGWGATQLGHLGPTIGWSLWNTILVVTTIVCGLMTGEWRGAEGRPLRLLFTGMAILIGGMCVLGMGANS